MQWLTEIFNSSSDQARLVTTLIVAFIAFIIVFINQWFSSRRARKDKLIEKLEQMYSVISRLQSLQLSIHSEVVNNFLMKKDMKN